MSINKIYMRFPEWKAKAMTLSYDDAVVYDKTLIEIMQKYGLKGTFNVNSALFGYDERHLTKEQAVELYTSSGMEVAVHGEYHLWPTKVPSALAMKEFLNDRINIEKDFNKITRGMAYAFGDYNDSVVDILNKVGIVYGRTVESSLTFDIPKDWLRLKPTCRHAEPKLMELLESFLNANPNESFSQDPLLFYLWGHSYEFNDSNNWYIIENFAKRVAQVKDIYHATNIEIYDYVNAFERLIYSADGSFVFNPTLIDVYMLVDNKKVVVKSNQTIKI